MKIQILKDNKAVAEAFASYFASWLHDKDRVAVALSGGSTPKALFERWAERYRDSISWESIHFFWGDERCVPPGHPESNYGQAKALFFDKIAIPEENIHRIKGEAPPEAEAARYGQEIRRWTETGDDGRPVFDLILLGVGADGHTASVFPDQMHLLTGSEICAVARHPETGQRRITLTGTVINAARSVAFLVAGESKAPVVREILGRSDSRQKYPAALIQPVTGELFWFLDRHAARELPDVSSEDE